MRHVFIETMTASGFHAQVPPRHDPGDVPPVPNPDPGSPPVEDPDDEPPPLIDPDVTDPGPAPTPPPPIIGRRVAWSAMS